MSRQHHDCPPMHARKSFLPDITLASGKVGWVLGVEEYSLQIRFCPFCGKDLETESLGTLCGDPPPSDWAPKITGFKGVHVHGVERRPERPVTQWEYKVFYCDWEARRTLLDTMNDLGKEGWEVFQVDVDNERMWARRPTPLTVERSSSEGKVT